MRQPALHLLAATALALTACATTGGAPARTATYGGTVAELRTPEITREWPDAARDAAVQIEQRYGAPAEVTPTQLVWHRAGPWKRIVVYNLAVPHAFPWPHSDVIEQTVTFRVPPEMYDDVAAFNGSITIGRTSGEVSVRGESEAMNFLALNLMHDVIAEVRTVEQARGDFARHAAALMNGQSHSYTSGLMFTASGADTRDADRPVTPAPDAGKP
jgi:hypothetical protein